MNLNNNNTTKAAEDEENNTELIGVKEIGNDIGNWVWNKLHK